MADVVLSEHVERAGLSGRVTVNSCGTGDWHTGQPMDRRAAASLAAAGFDPTRHRARLFDPGWLDRHDLVLAMDERGAAVLHVRGIVVLRASMRGELDQRLGKLTTDRCQPKEQQTDDQ